MRRLSTAIIIMIAAALSAGIESDACTNVLVTKGASVDGSNMVSYAADSHQLYGELYYAPAGVWNEGDMRKINEWDTGKYLGEIPQIAMECLRLAGYVDGVNVLSLNFATGSMEDYFIERMGGKHE